MSNPLFDFMKGSTETDPMSSDITLTRTSHRVQIVTPDAAGRRVILPDATGLDAGGPRYLIVNLGADSVEIQDDGNNTLVAALAQNQASLVCLADISTSDGIWIFRETTAGSTPAPSGRVLGFAVGGGSSALAVPIADTEAYDAPPDSWADKQDMLQALLWGGGFSVADLGFTCYGRNSGGTKTRITDEYNRVTDVWTNKANAPTNGRERCPATDINGKGFTCGGFDTGSVSIDDMEEYTEGSNTWASKTDMPNTRRRHGFFTLGNDGFILAGVIIGSPTLDGDKYSESGDSYSSMADVPTSGGTSRGYFATFVASGKGYVACGQNNGGDPRMRDLDEYSPDTWTGRTPAPVPKRQYIRGFAIDNKGYIQGGHSTPPSVVQVQNDKYDPVGDSWATVAPMVQKRTVQMPFATK